MTNQNPKNSGLNLHGYKMDMTQAVMKEITTLIEAERRDKGDRFSHELAMTFLGSFISTYLFNFLKANAESIKSPDEVWDSYAILKSHIETAIQQGFEAGMHQFNPASYPEYQCDITLLTAGMDDGKKN